MFLWFVSCVLFLTAHLSDLLPNVSRCCFKKKKVFVVCFFWS